MCYQNVLEDLYYGNINPDTKCFDRDSEYAKFLGIVADNEEKLTKFLEAMPNAKEEAHLLSQMTNAQIEVMAFSERDKFIEGFTLGARVMLDTFVSPQQSVLRDI